MKNIRLDFNNNGLLFMKVDGRELLYFQWANYFQ